jgi:hypothetical protein
MWKQWTHKRLARRRNPRIPGPPRAARQVRYMRNMGTYSPPPQARHLPRSKQPTRQRSSSAAPYVSTSFVLPKHIACRLTLKMQSRAPQGTYTLPPPATSKKASSSSRRARPPKADTGRHAVAPDNGALGGETHVMAQGATRSHLRSSTSREGQE